MRGLSVSIAQWLSLAAFGQQSSLGLSDGPSLCRLRGNSIFEQVDPIMGYQFGANYTSWFKSGFGVQGQLTYAGMGGALDFIGYNQIGEETFRDQTVYRFGHLCLSLGASYRTRGRVHCVLALGVRPATTVVAEVQQPDPLRPNDRYVMDLTAKVKNPVVFGYGAFGGAVDLKAPITIGLLVRYHHGLTTLSRSDFFETEDIIETSWSLALSLSYRWSQGN